MVASGGQLLKSGQIGLNSTCWRTEKKDHRHLLFASIRKPDRQKRHVWQPFQKVGPRQGRRRHTILFFEMAWSYLYSMLEVGRSDVRRSSVIHSERIYDNHSINVYGTM
jgi:hypothetical protein